MSGFAYLALVVILVGGFAWLVIDTWMLQTEVHEKRRKVSRMRVELAQNRARAARGEPFVWTEELWKR